METPKISVIVPVYNSERYLSECLNSIVNQTLNEIEIICVDNGCTDSSGDIIRQYATCDSRIKVISKYPNVGYGAAINAGIVAALGEYIGIVDSDDYIVGNMYETLYGIAKNEKLEIVKADYSRFWGEGDSRRFQERKLSNKKVYYSTVFDPSQDTSSMRTNVLIQPGIYSRKMILENNIRLHESPGASYQDNGLRFLLFFHAHSARFIPAPMYMLRRDNENSSVNSKEKTFCMCAEFDFIRNELIKRDASHMFLEMCAYLRFEGYVWTEKRIAHRNRHDFILKASDDIKKLQDIGELNSALFDVRKWRDVCLLINDPEEYYYSKWVQDPDSRLREARLREARLKEARLKERIDALEGSVSYKVGRALTAIPRKAKKVLRAFAAPTSKGANEREKRCEIAENELPQLLCDWYYQRTGSVLNLDNPITFNEKIQWLKLYDSTELKSRLTDKVLVRDWVAERIGEKHLVPLIGVWDSFDEIDFKAFPESFILKMNNSNEKSCVVQSLEQFSYADTKKMFHKWNEEYSVVDADFELYRYRIQPKILAERLITRGEQESSQYLYRFFCFDGKPYAIWLDTGSGTKEHRRDVYDMSWQIEPLRATYDNIPGTVEPPDNLDEMIRIAEKLSQGFLFVCVDLCNVAGKIYFHEMTFAPQSGIGKWDPPEYNNIYGDMLHLPPKDKVINMHE